MRILRQTLVAPLVFRRHLVDVEVAGEANLETPSAQHARPIFLPGYARTGVADGLARELDGTTNQRLSVVGLVDQLGGFGFEMGDLRGRFSRCLCGNSVGYLP